MNCFLHGIEDFRIERGDTLGEPKFVQGDHLMRFDLVLANPPYSIKQWDRTAKSKAHRGKILFINAVSEVTRERAQSFLTEEHIERIVKVYESFQDEPGFARVATREEIRAKEGNLSIPLYVTGSSPVTEVRDSSATYNLSGTNGSDRLTEALAAWLESSRQVRKSLDSILK